MSSVEVKQGPVSTGELASQAKAAWDGAKSPDAVAFLREHPELADNRALVLDLVHDEACYRSTRGEAIDPDAYAAGFPNFRSSIAKVVYFCLFMNSNRRLTAGDSTRPWPHPGDQAAGFDFKEVLGRGAFARVYLARETALGHRPVVVKVSDRGGAEAEILGRLRHDNIVPVYSIQQDSITGLTMVCMPYLGRRTLYDVLDRAFTRPQVSPQARIILEAVAPAADEEEILGRFTPSKTLLHGTYEEGIVDLGIQLAEALAFVHERKIFHRDLKPSNVLIRPDGRPMLLDFNLSFDENAKQQPLGGTLHYMSPEQLRATDENDPGPVVLDGRADLYSLGVMLYECLSGTHPFSPIPAGRKIEEIRRLLQERQRQGFRSLRQANPNVDRRLAKVVEKCLAPDPSARFQTAGELGQALRKCLGPVPRLRRRLARQPGRVLAAVLAGLAAALALGVALSLRAPSRDRQYQEGVEAYQEGRFTRAVAIFSRALAEEDSARSYFARGRAYMKLGNFAAAANDFRMADQLQPSGPTKACLAYCCSQADPSKPAVAVAYYKDAIKAGFATPAVLNNLGVSLLGMRGGDPEAMKHFQQAFAQDPTFQLAYFNRALVDITKKAKNPRLSVSRQGLEAMDKVFAVGPAGGGMHLQAARLYALGRDVEPGWKERALEHLEKALKGGVDPAQVRQDRILNDAFRDEARFSQLARQELVRPEAPPVTRVLDPVENLGNEQ
jgi:serine/threonine protein kinase/Flp pilus assembly protein TadD